MRAEKVRGDVVDIDFIDDFFSCDGRVVAENRLTLQEVTNDIAQLSMDQRNVIRLVCECSLSYDEVGKILNLPAGTVMSRLARARVALHEVRRGAHLSNKPSHGLSVDRYGQARERN